MSRDASGRMLTEGRRQLLAIAKLCKGAELARRLRVSRSHLSEILSGEHRPSFDLMVRIFRELGIPIIDWSATQYRKWESSRPLS
jgi:transcriptional regulator with XRE-family HTH domain